ncbi:hypothetical protein HBN99_01605 [Pseudomonas oryzihabitans]|uniref:HEPN domain-containing protein n=1 Tax=Pseudomonas oryzihabitans TaxID=47885 RepID=UPI0014740DA2|nr:HEPN domain-containing protein [Pseudomonas oryzihabitans]NMZ63013.1 hypothetical protein [Pseudomonas oryzihabitans]
MTYKKSIARHTAEKEFIEVKNRIRLSQSKAIQPAVREYVVAAAVFLAHSTLENYISDLFSGIAKAFHSSLTEGKQLPEFVKSHLFIENLNKAKIYSFGISAIGEQEMLSAISESLRGRAGSLLDSNRQKYAFTGKDLYTNHKYPSEKNLKKIFQRIGINNFFQEINAILKRDSLSLLESLGSLRTSLAHTGQLTGISPSDVIEKISDIGKLIGAIDRRTYKLIASTYGRDCWYSNVALATTP